MPKLTGPLMSLGAKGSLKKSLTYQKTLTGHKVYKYMKPGVNTPFIPSATQRDKRMLFNLIVARWQTMTDGEREYYNNFVKNLGLSMSGFNWFFKEALKDLPAYLGLQGYWSFNKIAGDKILDLSGNGNDGILKPSFPADCPVLSDSINAKFSKACDFDGVNDYVDCGDDETLNITDKITIEVWINPGPDQEYCWDGLKGNYGVAGKVESYIASTNWSWQLRYGSPDSCCLGFQFNEIGTGSKWVTIKQNLIPGRWYHVVGTYDGITAKCYLDGVETDSNILAGIVGYSNKLLICCEGWTNYFTGKVDEFRIFNRALSVEEIQKHYRLKFSS